MESKIKHLEFIQGVINRVAGNSFLLKGWCVTLVAGLLGLTGKELTVGLMLTVYYVIVAFWLIDTYFLWQEKLFRALYESVCRRTGETDFSMDTSMERKGILFTSAILSAPSLGFYMVMAVAVIIIGLLKSS